MKSCQCLTCDPSPGLVEYFLKTFVVLFLSTLAVIYTVTFVLKEKLLKLEDSVLSSFIYVLISFVNYAYHIYGCNVFMFSFLGVCPECSYKLNFHHR